ncbi:NAD-dependent epimerase/dehydratase family protein [Pontibacter sp. E15-1]|uniref:NAD-dependent epimerase/dehydratase family protein n=1 Tax=Pontibacter sp. E15-1 TaxID=2919918 RepID=UPI001F5024D2|nr:NAD-dependent epimerase/dehydratase family protein [Pontibacter sp. E15-1]MCJ8165366.1 NAD-dependent epimerase/dehydratase family protein [Pontibacter sp. E15-1]
MAKRLRVLVTGSAGFIGHHLALALQELGCTVVGLDAILSYYDPMLKYGRLALQGFERHDIRYNQLLGSNLKEGLSFIHLDLTDELALNRLFEEQRFDVVVNLAAQAGVRYSMDHPQSYVTSNLVGFANVLESCRQHHIKHLLFASSSSVYGLNQETPFKTSMKTDQPISFYAATKKANEVMAHSYAHLYQIPMTGLRFFTVYGPWGRPDMAYYSFTKAILAGTPIKVFNNGNMHRDFTFIDDVVRSIVKLIDVLPAPAPTAPYKIYNIGNSQPEHLLELIATIERLLGKKAIIDLHPMQPGDVEATFADVEDLKAAADFHPDTPLAEGLAQFVAWYLAYHGKQAKNAMNASD